MSRGIAFLGPVQSFTHQAAVKFAQTFPCDAELVPQSSLQKVFQAVNDNAAEFGVVAIENNVEGFIGETLDLLMKYQKLQVVDMLWLPIKFDAISTCSDKNLSFNTVIAHPHAMAQCTSFIEEHKLQKLPALSNSAAALELANGQLALVPHGSKFEDRKVVLENVQDYEQAKTQFVLITKRGANVLHEADNTHNIWALTPETDRQGMLVDILKVIAKYDVNISTLISRPVKEITNRYSFFMTLDADFDTTKQCVQEIEQLKVESHHLGWYATDAR